MTIGSNSLVAIDNRDTNNVSTGAAAVNLYGTTANTANVTQLTSRTTGVTINGAVGSITLVSAANSATASTFTVTNSFVAANDTVLVTQQSGTDPRSISVTTTTNGTFNVTSASISGTTTESPVYNFVVIKGSLI